MKLVPVLFIASLASAAPPGLFFPFKLPCSSISGTPCICPPNTQYNESTTMSYVGATASDVESIVNDYFNVGWAGFDLVMVQGPDNFPGLSIRDLNMNTAVGTYTFSERLILRFVNPDGSFEQRSEQREIIPYRSGNGTFSGHWVTLKGDRIFENETLVRVTRYFCQTGHPIDFAGFDQLALSNVTNILAAAGKINGISSDPASAQRF
ncbi:hypothetical protein F4803DRAFT_558349 [Xylaria telfairii]|nr:hypothetical protein F4803DRAFT_558349 [Xylaria telfairii]